MTLENRLFMPAIAALLFLGCSAASACNVGDIQCENGYRYVCKCWTGYGCNYDRDGTCYRDDIGDPPAVNSSFHQLMNKYFREARLVCASSHATVPPEACAER